MRIVTSFSRRVEPWLDRTDGDVLGLRELVSSCVLVGPNVKAKLLDHAKSMSERTRLKNLIVDYLRAKRICMADYESPDDDFGEDNYADWGELLQYGLVEKQVLWRQRHATAGKSRDIEFARLVGDLGKLATRVRIYDPYLGKGLTDAAASSTENPATYWIDSLLASGVTHLAIVTEDPIDKKFDRRDHAGGMTVNHRREAIAELVARRVERVAPTATVEIDFYERTNHDRIVQIAFSQMGSIGISFGQGVDTLWDDPLSRSRTVNEQRHPDFFSDYLSSSEWKPKYGSVARQIRLSNTASKQVKVNLH